VVLLVDNFDSFTWNVVHAAARVAPGVRLEVVRADAIDAAGAEAMAPTGIILSPGPCGPEEAPASMGIIRALAGRVPILGICLGHQCIGAAFGMRVVRGPEPVHGRMSTIEHDGLGVFAGVQSPMEAMRYHSLVVERGSIDEGAWAISAWLRGEDGPGGLVMGLRRRWDRAALEGVQFHPESFGTPEGERVIGNFLRMCGPGSAADCGG